MKIDLSKINEKLEFVWQFFKRYRVILFIVFLAVIYGFLIFRINSLGSQQPSNEEVSAQLTRISAPRIDESVVNKIEQLKDNSVQVNTLFNEARQNPFKE